MDKIMEKSLGSTAISNEPLLFPWWRVWGEDSSMRRAVLCRGHTGSLVDRDVQREVGAGGSKPYRKPIPIRRKIRAWTRVIAERMARTLTKGIPDKSYEIDDLVKGDKVREDGKIIYRIRGHGKKNRNFLVGAWGKN